MQHPLQITFRGMTPSDAVVYDVRERADKLDELFDHIVSGRVVIEAPHKRHHKGNVYRVLVHLAVPGEEIVVGRAPGEEHEHEDLYVALRDSFDETRRRLQEYTARRQSVRVQRAMPHGRVVRMSPGEGYGFLRTEDGREIYFHKNSVLEGAFTRLHVGSDVRFVEEMGTEGPQASTVVFVSAGKAAAAH